MAKDNKEYKKAWKEAHKEELRVKRREYYQAHKEEIKAKKNAYYQTHKEEHKAYIRVYKRTELNSLGQTRDNVRSQSNYYLKKYGKKITGYEIHHCFTYDDPKKFIYCSKEKHLSIHAYLREHNIDADSNHYEQIKHLLDDTVVIYGLE